MATFSRRLGEKVIVSLPGQSPGAIVVRGITRTRVSLSFELPYPIKADRREVAVVKGIVPGDRLAPVGEVEP